MQIAYMKGPGASPDSTQPRYSSAIAGIAAMQVECIGQSATYRVITAIEHVIGLLIVPFRSYPVAGRQQLT